MTQTLVFQIEVQAPDRLAAYREVAGPALQKHGGAVAAANPAPEALDPNGGATGAPGMLAVLTFPSAEAARAWMQDPALAEIHAMRNAAGPAQFWML